MGEIKLTPNRYGKSVANEMMVRAYLKKYPEAVICYASHEGLRFSKPVKLVDPLLISYDECPKDDL